jgi:hypothetical protein
MIMPQLGTSQLGKRKIKTGETAVRRLRVALTSMAALSATAAIVTISGAAHADFQTG